MVRTGRRAPDASVVMATRAPPSSVCPIDGRDRKRLEHVLRYMARPPLALARLGLRDDGRIAYRFKKVSKDWMLDGSTTRARHWPALLTLVGM